MGSVRIAILAALLCGGCSLLCGGCSLLFSPEPSPSPSDDDVPDAGVTPDADPSAFCTDLSITSLQLTIQPGEDPTQARIVAGDGEYGIVWVDKSSSVWFAPLDSEGGLLAQPIMLGKTSADDPSIVYSPEQIQYVVSWLDADQDAVAIDRFDQNLVNTRKYVGQESTHASTALVEDKLAIGYTTLAPSCMSLDIEPLGTGNRKECISGTDSDSEPMLGASADFLAVTYQESDSQTILIECFDSGLSKFWLTSQGVVNDGTVSAVIGMADGFAVLYQSTATGELVIRGFNKIDGTEMFAPEVVADTPLSFHAAAERARDDAIAVAYHERVADDVRLMLDLHRAGAGVTSMLVGLTLSANVPSISVVGDELAMVWISEASNGTSEVQFATCTLR